MKTRQIIPLMSSMCGLFVHWFLSVFECRKGFRRFFAGIVWGYCKKLIWGGLGEDFRKKYK